MCSQDDCDDGRDIMFCHGGGKSIVVSGFEKRQESEVKQAFGKDIRNIISKHSLESQKEGVATCTTLNRQGAKSLFTAIIIKTKNLATSRFCVRRKCADALRTIRQISCLRT
jgi:hypothetical protein